MPRTLASLTLVLLLAVASPSVAADVIAFWDFNKLGDGSVEKMPATTGAGTVTLFGGSVVPDGQRGVRTTVGDKKVSGGQAAAWGGGVNDEGPNGLTISIDGTGKSGLSLLFHVRSTKVGAPTFDVECRSGGGEFAPVAKEQELAGDTDFHETTIDLSKAGVDDAKDVEIRIVFAEGKSNGTTRIDNLQVLGTSK